MIWKFYENCKGSSLAMDRNRLLMRSAIGLMIFALFLSWITILFNSIILENKIVQWFIVLILFGVTSLIYFNTYRKATLLNSSLFAFARDEKGVLYFFDFCTYFFKNAIIKYGGDADDLRYSGHGIASEYGKANRLDSVIIDYVDRLNVIEKIMEEYDKTMYGYEVIKVLKIIEKKNYCKVTCVLKQSIHENKKTMVIPVICDNYDELKCSFEKLM